MTHEKALLPPIMLDEGLRLLFPAAAIHGALWPLLWTLFYGLDLPLARDIPTSQWHAHEMIFGTYGMALAGFLTTAVPEWTDTPRRRDRDLLLLLGLWLPGRVAGLFGADLLVGLTGVSDAAFLLLLTWFIAKPLLDRRSTRHLSFPVWCGLFAGMEIAIRLAWITGAYDFSARLLEAALAIFLVFFSLSVARINVVVINLALDPSGETTPYRPHPGRQNLAAGLVALYVAALLVLPESLAPAFLALAAGAAFFDRLAEWFIGRAVFKAQVLGLFGANLMAGLGFFVIGAAGLGAPLSAHAGLHLLSMGSLGLAVISVFVIAGLLHTGRDLVLPPQAHWALGLMLLAALMRTLPELGMGEALLGLHYGLAALLWAGAFGVWLHGFLPYFATTGVQAPAR
ncbi:MAG TPA: NnrS family protein [Devosia sp.]|nr:NnrS family protein [Devosia sp.]